MNEVEHNPLSYLSTGKKKSKQVVSTPPALLDFVRLVFGQIALDLAANKDNRVAPHFLGENTNSLTTDWYEACRAVAAHLGLDRDGRPLCFLNPPFAKTGPWMSKCDKECRRGVHIVALVPNTQEADWFWRTIFQPDDAGQPQGPCTVYPLKERLIFPGYYNKKTGKPQSAGQGHWLIDWHGGPWGGIRPVDWKRALKAATL